jgi:hypothetical protein
MPTYGQLNDEDAWRDEIAAPALQTLGLRLYQRWPGAQIGVRGDNEHLSGYHRSRRWIKESIYCTNHTYSVSRTPGDRTGGNPNWACAVDLGGIPQTDLHAVCRRLDAAVRAGRLEKITEWYGNFGNDGRVDGYDNISNRLASSDASHLFHLHMSFDRGRANEDHSDVLAILTGENMNVLVKTLNDPAGKVYHSNGSVRWWIRDEQTLADVIYLAASGQTPPLYRGGEIQLVGNIDAYGVEIGVAAPVELTDEQLAKLSDDVTEGVLAGMPQAATKAEVRDAVADGLEGGAAKVRAGD